MSLKLLDLTATSLLLNHSSSKVGWTEHPFFNPFLHLLEVHSIHATCRI